MLQTCKNKMAESVKRQKKQKIMFLQVFREEAQIAYTKKCLSKTSLEWVTI